MRVKMSIHKRVLDHLNLNWLNPYPARTPIPVTIRVVVRVTTMEFLRYELKG